MSHCEDLLGCGTSKYDRNEKVTIVLEGVEFSIKRGVMKCDSCTCREFLENLNSGCAGLFSVVNGSLKVNWEMYVSRCCRDENHSMFSYLLHDIGVFSLEAQGNWCIVADGGVFLNPRLTCSILYFTRREDAIRFSQLRLKNTLYSWSICQYGEVLTKRAALLEK